MILLYTSAIDVCHALHERSTAKGRELLEFASLPSTPSEVHMFAKAIFLFSEAQEVFVHRNPAIPG